MAAMLIEIKSRMLLPVKKADTGEEAEDPRAELVRRLLEYEQMKLAAQRIDHLPQLGRDFLRADVYIEQSITPRFPDVEQRATCAPRGPTSSSAPSSSSITRFRARNCRCASI